VQDSWLEPRWRAWSALAGRASRLDGRRGTEGRCRSPAARFWRARGLTP